MKILSVFITSNFVISCTAFNSIKLFASRFNSKLFLKDEVAEMIDRELYRLQHKNEYDIEQFQKQKTNILSREILSEAYNELELEQEYDLQHRKDTRLAQKSPEQYCADRCLTTGNCDVFEDFFELSPTEVIKFCSECVLSDDEEPCDIKDEALDKYIHEEGLTP